MPGVIRRVYDATWGRVFARGYEFFLRQSEEAGLRDMRAALLSDASGRTLEVGAGTGFNLEHYPEAVTELVLTEPFGPMADQLRAKIGDSGRPAEVVEAPGEALPFPDDSFDTVALTLVLCTIPDPAAALREIARVLKPGGRFLFLEHVRSEEPGLAKWQDRLHGPWFAFGHGCHCNRDTLATIESSPLEVERAGERRDPKAVPPYGRCCTARVPSPGPPTEGELADEPPYRRPAGARSSRRGRGPRAGGDPGGRPGLLPGGRARERGGHRLHAQRQRELQPRQPGLRHAHRRCRPAPFAATASPRGSPGASARLHPRGRDAANPANFATINPLATVFDVSVKPQGGNPARRRRIAARGFTEGKTLYVHVRRAGKGKNIRLGRLKQPCGTKKTRKRIFRRTAKTGTYKVQFDTRRRYTSKAFPKVTFRVRIFRVFRPSIASARIRHRRALGAGPLAQTPRSG